MTLDPLKHVNVYQEGQTIHVDVRLDDVSHVSAESLASLTPAHGLLSLHVLPPSTTTMEHWPFVYCSVSLKLRSTPVLCTSYPCFTPDGRLLPESRSSIVSF